MFRPINHCIWTNLIDQKGELFDRFRCLSDWEEIWVNKLTMEKRWNLSENENLSLNKDDFFVFKKVETKFRTTIKGNSVPSEQTFAEIPSSL